MVERRTVLIYTSNEQRDAKRTTHHAVVLVVVLAELEREVAHGLRAALEGHRLVVREAVVLRLRARMLDEHPRIRHESAHRAANVRVDLHDLLDRRRLQEGRREALLTRKNDTLARLDSNCRRSELLTRWN